MRTADRLFNNHRHLLFFQTEGRGAEISLGVLAEGRCVDPFDGLVQILQSRVELRIAVGEHKSVIHAGEGLVLRILQKTRQLRGEQ